MEEPRKGQHPLAGEDVRDLSMQRLPEERQARADTIRQEREDTEDLRSDRARRLEHERDDRAKDLAIQAALAQAEIHRRLSDSELRLNKINGSIDRFDASLITHERIMSKMESSFNEYVAISKAIQDKSVDTRTFIFGVIGIVIALLVPMLMLYSTLKH